MSHTSPSNRRIWGRTSSRCMSGMGLLSGRRPEPRSQSQMLRSLALLLPAETNTAEMPGTATWHLYSCQLADEGWGATSTQGGPALNRCCRWRLPSPPLHLLQPRPRGTHHLLHPPWSGQYPRRRQPGWRTGATSDLLGPGGMDAGPSTSCPPSMSPHPHFQSSAESHGFHGSHRAWSSDAKCAWRRKEVEAVGVAGFSGYPCPFQGAHSALLWTQGSRSLILFAGGQSFPLEKLTPLGLVSSNPRRL